MTNVARYGAKAHSLSVRIRRRRGSVLFLQGLIFESGRKPLCSSYVGVWDRMVYDDVLLAPYSLGVIRICLMTHYMGVGCSFPPPNGLYMMESVFLLP